MTLKIKDTGLTPEDEIRLSRAVESAQGQNSGPWLTPEQYASGGADLARNQIQFGHLRMRKAVEKAEERERLVNASLSEAAATIEEQEQKIVLLQAEVDKLKRKK